MANADEPVRYMERTRHYYRALGYSRDYNWATFDDVPFVRLDKPLSKLRIALVTTASPPLSNGVKQVWSGSISPPPPTLFTANVAWDKDRSCAARARRSSMAWASSSHACGVICRTGASAPERAMRVDRAIHQGRGPVVIDLRPG
jgi:hypothetical protein